MYYSVVTVYIVSVDMYMYYTSIHILHVPMQACICTSSSVCACVHLYWRSPTPCQHVAQDDKSPFTISSHAALHCVAGSMFPCLSDTQASGLAAKLPPLLKWSSHLQGERLNGITHFVLGILFSLPARLSGMDMAGWL